MDQKIRVIAEVPGIDKLQSILEEHKRLVQLVETNAQLMYSAVTDINMRLTETAEGNQQSL